MPKLKDLSERQLKFAQLYPFYGTVQAVKLAGYKPKNNEIAGIMGRWNLRNFKIQEIVNKAREYLKFKSMENVFKLDELTNDTNKNIRLKAIQDSLDRAEIVPPARVVQVNQNYQPVVVEVGNEKKVIDIKREPEEAETTPEKSDV